MPKSFFVIIAIVFLAACSSIAPVKPPTNFLPQIFSDQTLSNGGRKVGIQSLSGNQDIWVTSIDGSTTPIRLTDSIANDYSPAWSPNGLKIAFVSERDNNPEIYVMNVDGKAQTRLTNNSTADTFPAWSPDGKYIAFASNRDNNFEIYVMNNDGSEQSRVTNNVTYDILPAWSLDGQLIAYISAPTETAEANIYVIKPDGIGQISYIDFAIPDKSVLKFDPNGKKKNCSAFKTQVEAQLFFIAAGGPLRDPHELENGGVKGLACESLP
jgi:Tol biopolymer transport system component